MIAVDSGSTAGTVELLKKLSVRAGWAQVNGWRSDTSIAKRVEYDLYYLRNWSLTFDLQMVTLTFLRLFNSNNAH